MRDLITLAAQLTEDEGRRLDLYFDTRGNPSIGVGRNLRNGISNAVCDLMLQEDMATAAAAVAAHWPWSDGLPDAQWNVLIGLCFNLGAAKLSGFVRFLAAMEIGDWAAAAMELRNSDWWNEVGERGPRTVARLLASSSAAA